MTRPLIRNALQCSRCRKIIESHEAVITAVGSCPPRRLCPDCGADAQLFLVTILKPADLAALSRNFERLGARKTLREAAEFFGFATINPRFSSYLPGGEPVRWKMDEFLEANRDLEQAWASR